MPTYRQKPVDLAIDVRSKLEFWLGHLPGAVCMPVGSIADAIVKRTDLTRDSRIFVYCASGARSRMAADTLRALGYRKVTDGGAMSSCSRDFRN